MKVMFFLFFIFYSSWVFAGLKEEALKEVPESKLITVTGHPDYPPVVWVSSGKKLQGVAVELVEMAFAELGVKVKAVNSQTWGRAQEEVKEGRVDVLLPPYKTEERVKIYHYYKAPILMDETVIFVKKGKKFSYKKHEDLIGKNGVAIIDDSFGAGFDKLIKKKLKIERLAKTEQCFEFLLKDRAEYMIAGVNAGTSVAKKVGIDREVEILPKRVVITGMYAPISLKSKWDKPAIHNFINSRIEAYTKNGITKKLEKKYWGIFIKSKDK